jgi:RHS repeat-associated protein
MTDGTSTFANGKSDAGEAAPSPFAPPQIALPKGGGAIQGIGEKFAANPVTGTGALTVPITLSPGRYGFGPQVALTYDSGTGNGPFGMGWNLALPAITRKTDKGLPRYDDGDDSDVFVLSGIEDLVPFRKSNNGYWSKVEIARTIYGKNYLVRRYRPRVESLFARIERFTNISDPTDVFWRSIAKDNTATWYGKTRESRIADPSDPSRIFSWLVCELHDDKGDVVSFRYAAENGDGVPVGAAHERNRTLTSRSANRYLTHVRYGNRTPYFPDLSADAAVALPDDWCFELVLDYGEHDADVPLPHEPGKTWSLRVDPFSSYRAGFEVRSYRLCRRMLMFHHFPADANVGMNCLVRSTDLIYNEDVAPSDPRNPIYSKLISLTRTGYRRTGGGYLSRSLPPLSFAYTEPSLSDAIRDVDRESLENLPEGLDGARYQWVDLDGEGIAGILTEQGGAWYYKRNLSPIDAGNGFASAPRVRFAPAEQVGRVPSLAALGGGTQQLLDLDGGGHLDLVQFGPPHPGFFERTDDEAWETFRPFAELPVLDWTNPNLKFVDLTGDGHADILISEDAVLWWHESHAHEGFGPAHKLEQAVDEEMGPKYVFSDGTDTIFLADLSGDGLTDIVRVRNGEVCYWPNLGYGRFGPKVTMENAPWFEASDLFDGRRVRLADIDGSGTADLVYFSHRGAQIYFNQSGNGWSEKHVLDQVPPVDGASAAMVLDLLGTGTACLVWSSSLPGAAGRMRYVDLMGSVKPHLLTKIDNHLGVETRVHYASSTQFYLADKLAGKPWITRLPFPVHVVSRMETYDFVSRNLFVARYAYHHGHFDGVEREFRGFGMVEQWDTEDFAALSDRTVFPNATNVDAASHVPPVLTRTWFHTGIYLGRNRVSNYFAGLLDANGKGEYYREPGLADAQARGLLLEDTVLPDDLSVEDEREACRALKGSMLRQEVYALDASAKEPHPYTVLEQNFTTVLLQPHAGKSYGSFFVHPRESISYHYERVPDDPRVTHALTLDVDEFGNVRRSLAVGYGRRRANPALTLADQQKQSAVLVTYAENAYTQAIDQLDAYRAPLPSDQRTYELTGLQPAKRFTFHEWRADNFNRLDSMAEIPFEQAPDETKEQKRLIKRTCTRYRRNDLSALLPQDAAESQALVGESYSLAFTPGLLTQIYHHKIGGGPDEILPAPALVLGGRDGDQGGYVDLFADGHWWAPSGRTFFDVNADILNPGATAATELAEARAHFYLTRKFVDPFGHGSTAEYDADDLVVVRTSDAIGNTVSVENDWRVLQPRQLTDANGNQTNLAFDALGTVAAIAVAGKSGENLGDLLSEFELDLTQADIDAFFDALDPSIAAPALLGQATTRFVYDTDRFSRTRAAHPDDPSQWLPAQGATLARETHVGDLAAGQNSRISISFSYSDGFHRVVQNKVQAEPGPLTQGGPSVELRWVGNGWTIFDNKGHPVRQYEPCFSASHKFEFANVVGVSPIVFYDPVGRAVATLYPNHLWKKIVFDAWRDVNWDASDTVLIADPRADADVGNFFNRLPATDYLPSWHARRAGGALGPREQDAAIKAAVHARTPLVSHFDPLARTFLGIAHNKLKYSNTAPGDPPTEAYYATRAVFDIEGNQLTAVDAQDRVVMRFDYDMIGRRIRQVGMDGGERWVLADAINKPIRAWDARNHTIRTVYDAARRAIESHVREGAGAERLVMRTEYGEGQPAPETTNLRGKTFRISDPAGQLTSDAYDFKGNLLQSRRQLTAQYDATPDWSGAVALDPVVYSSSTRYDAMNRAIEMTAPDNSVLRPTYNKANLLEQVEGNLRGAAAITTFVDDIDYDAKGQRVLIAYGNGAQTTYDYDPETFRIVNLTTIRPSFPADEQLVQDLSYTYDPLGNITSIRDDARQTIYFRNKRVEPSTNYTYDAVGRLIEARGREHLGQTGGLPNAPTAPDAFDRFNTGLDQPGDGAAMGTYVERYVYSAVGNILAMQHRGTDPAHPGWTRVYAYNEASLIEPAKASNRVSSTQLDPVAVETYSHDAHGNMISMPHLPLMRWDFKDQLQASAQQAVTAGAPETTYYAYDAAGERVRKVTDRAAAPGETPARRKERIYVGGFEIYREYAHDGTTVTLERQTLPIHDDKQRIALVETRVDSANDPSQIIRYQLGNHLGSVALELDQVADIISYEEYTPYGSTSYQAVRADTEAPKRYRYTGKERDEESGFYYYGARYYAPWLGRWLSGDPVGIADDINLYCYVHCNPLMHVDPSGTFSKDTYDKWLKDHIKSGEADVKRRDKQLEETKEKKEKAEERIEEIGTEKEQVEADIESVAKKRAPLESKKTKLTKQEKKDLQKLKAENTRLVGQKNKLNTEEAKLERAGTDLGKKIETQEEGLERAKDRVEDLKDLQKKFDAAYDKATKQRTVADVGLLTDIVMNEARNNSPAAKKAIAYAYTNDTAHHMKGGHVAAPPKKGSGSISHYQSGVTEVRFWASKDKVGYINETIESLEASGARLADTKNSADPTQGATNWVSPDAKGMKKKYPPNGIPAWAQSMTQIIAPGVPAGVFTFLK